MAFNCQCFLIIQLLWLAGALVWWARRGDVLPLVTSGFLFYVFGFRLWALLMGWARPVMLTPFGLQAVDLESGTYALGLAVLGQTALLGVYMGLQKRSFRTVRIWVAKGQGAWLRSFTLTLSMICLPLIFLTRQYVAAQMQAGRSLAFEISNYAFLFPFVLCSVAILMVTLWKAGQLHHAGWQILAAVLLACVAWLSFNSGGRFMFLGWMFASLFVVIAGLKMRWQFFFCAVGIAATLAVFGAAGALRGSNDPLEEVDIQKGAWNRIVSAEDANMLDGLVFIQQIYPRLLPYSYGGEHLGILLRPIPRALWPGKPVGGYLNELKLIDASDSTTLGISPSLFGDFYQEGGWIGIILLSMGYGWALAKLVAYSARVHVFAGVSIRALLCAFLIPLLRGGDLPGIYAWLGMAFWPYFLLFWLRRGDWFGGGKKELALMRARPLLPVPAGGEATRAGVSLPRG